MNKPNIILIVLDSARRDFFGCYGNNEGLTPNIDALAKDSMVLYDHYASGCGSAQAHVSLFLGQHSVRHGVVHNLSEMSPDIVALPKILKNAGYNTYGHCMASFIPPAGFEDLFGFDEFYYPGKESTSEKKGLKQILVDGLRKNPRLFNMVKNTYKKIKGPAATLKASALNFDGKCSLDFLRKRLLNNKNNGPIFAYTTLLHPHTPYYAPDWCLKQVFGKSPIDPVAFEIQSDMHGWVNGNFGDVPNAIDSLTKLYKAELLYADHLVGEFVRWLKMHGLFEDALFIVTADHGEMLGEHHLLNHGATVWEEIQRIPGIIHFPKKQEQGTIFKYLSSGLDIMPTILDAVGLSDTMKSITVCDGVSLTNKALDWDDRHLIVDAPPLVLPQRLRAYPKVVSRGSIFYRAIRNSKYKYIWQSNGKEFLYPVGVKEDDDSNSVLDETRENAQDMYKRMINWYLQINQKFKIDEYKINMGGTAAKKMTNPIIRQELKKLGYL